MRWACLGLLLMSFIADVGEGHELGKRVAVIGAGAAGLVATDVFTRHGLCVTTFEQSGRDIGGVWNYVGKTSTSGDNAPMYKTLRTNLPAEIMSFRPDAPMQKSSSGSSFLTHEEVQRYLEDFAEAQTVRNKIRSG